MVTVKNISDTVKLLVKQRNGKKVMYVIQCGACKNYPTPRDTFYMTME